MTDGPQPTVAFLGPEGSFTAQATNNIAPHARRVPLSTIPDVIDAIREGAAAVGVVPIENSIEGSVNVTLDALAFGDPGVWIRGEATLPIEMNLMAPAGTSLDAIEEIRSHPMALPQCRDWLAANLPGVRLVTTASTARAAQEVAGGDGTVAALGPLVAAEAFGLDVLARDVHDRDGNTTRFVVLGTRMAPPSGADKTSMVIFFGEDRPGLLMRVLDEFALRNINLNKIESRPTKQALGEYCIFIDAVGHVTEARMAEALKSVHRHVADVKILGTYPRMDGLQERPAGPDSEDAYAEASLWFRTLVSRIDQET